MKNNNQERDPYAKYAVDDNDPYAKYMVDKSPKKQKNMPLDEMMKDAILRSISGKFGDIGGQITDQLIPQNAESVRHFAQGFGQGLPESLYSGVRGFGQLSGADLAELPQQEAANVPQYLGQLLGKGAGYGAIAAPFVAGGEAAIPGLVGASLGAGASGALTTPGNYKERLATGLFESALPSAVKGLGEAGKLGMAAIKRKPTPRMAADVIQKAHAKEHAFATEPLNKAKELVYERELGPLRINPKVLDEVPQILGKDKATMTLLKEARGGDYKALDRLQSDLKREARMLIDPTKSHADRMLGKNANELATKILDGIKIQAEYKGHKDIADLITEGKNRYRNFAQTWLSNPTVEKLTGEEKIVPKNLLSKLESDTAFFNKFKKQVPEIDQILKLQKSQQSVKKHAKTVAGLAHGGALAKYLGGSQHNPIRD